MTALGSMSNVLTGLIALPLLLGVDLRSRTTLFGSGRRGADFGFTHKDGSWLDGESASFDVSHHLGARFDFHAVRADDVSVDFSVDYHGLCFHFSLDVCVFRNREGTIGADFTLDSTVNQEVVSETNRAFDVNIIAQNVSLATI